jgi:branched-chain amino acid transport system substrate-binding protein
VLYNRGLTAALLSVEGVRRAQQKYGKRALTGQEVRWGLENLAIDDAMIKKLGFSGFMTPVSTSCVNHSGDAQARIHTWDGKKWTVHSEIFHADNSIIKPMIRTSAEKYAAEKKVSKRDCAKDAD